MADRIERLPSHEEELRREMREPLPPDFVVFTRGGTPKPCRDYDEAVSEAKRVAGAHSGIIFGVYRLVGMAQAPTVEANFVDVDTDFAIDTEPGRPQKEGASSNPPAEGKAGAAAEDGRKSSATAAAPPLSHLRECSEAAKGESELIGPELPDDRHSVIEDDA